MITQTRPQHHHHHQEEEQEVAPDKQEHLTKTGRTKQNALSGRGWGWLLIHITFFVRGGTRRSKKRRHLIISFEIRVGYFQFWRENLGLYSQKRTNTLLPVPNLTCGFFRARHYHKCINVSHFCPSSDVARGAHFGGNVSNIQVATTTKSIPGEHRI